MDLTTVEKRCGCKHLEAATILNFYENLETSSYIANPVKLVTLSECDKCGAVWHCDSDGYVPEQLVSIIRQATLALVNNGDRR
jgi:hypothetical protein